MRRSEGWRIVFWICMPVLILAMAACDVLKADAWRASPYKAGELAASSGEQVALGQEDLEAVTAGEADTVTDLLGDEDKPRAAPVPQVAAASPPLAAVTSEYTDTACPVFGVLGDAVRHVKYVAGAGQSSGKVKYKAQIDSVNGICINDLAQKFEVSIDLTLTPGASANPEGALIRYVLGLVDAGGTILSRDTGVLLIPWLPGQMEGKTERSVTITHHFSGPVRVSVAGPRRVIAGLLINEQELLQNRSVSR